MGAGVFAITDIKKGEIVCVYVAERKGRRCNPELNCIYDLQFSDDCFMCARDVKYDHGYHQHNITLNWRNENPLVTYKGKAEPNYARYLNTVALDQRKQYDFNVEFQGVTDGTEGILVVAKEDILAGQELLVDYGTEFTILDASVEFTADGARKVGEVEQADPDCD